MGMFAGPSAPEQTYQTTNYLNMSALPLGQNYLPATTSWANAWSSFYPSVAAAHQKAVITIPMLMGALKDEDEEVRAAAVRGIERICERQR